MRLDRTHRSWAVCSAAFLLLAGIGYWAYAERAVHGPRGDTWIGLGYGVLGTLMILYAAFLGARKKMLLLRIGTLTWWMRGHLWIGLLSLPMILFHCAFRFGGPLTAILLTLLIIVVVSGLLGAALQHFMPTLITGALTDESTYEIMEDARRELRIEAFMKVAARCGRVEGVDQERREATESLDKPPVEKELAPAPIGLEVLRDLYRRQVAPYLRHPRPRGSPLSREMRATFLFDTIRVELDPALHDLLDDLAGICDEARQKTRQITLHRWLHGWLLFHVPLSMTLLVLTPVHAFMALYY